MSETADLAAETQSNDDFIDAAFIPDDALLVQVVQVAIEDEADDDGDDGMAVLNSNAMPAERYEARAADLFTNINYRSQLFGDSYPFEVSPDGKEISLRNLDVPSRKLYLQLLLSSSLRLVPKTRWGDITEPFEILSKVIFQCLMPLGWEVHRFGAKGSTRYPGLLNNRFRRLAKDIRASFSLKDADFKTGDHGDGGLDIVAWHPLGGDSRVGLPIAFAQCGCTAEEWSMKSLEPHPSSMPYLKPYHPWATYYFMPHDLVRATGNKEDWQRKRYLKETIVIDRLRIIRLASDYNVVDSCLHTPNFFEEVCKFTYA